VARDQDGGAPCCDHARARAFERIRHDGLLAPAAKTARLALARRLLAMPAAHPQARADAQAFMRRVAAIEITQRRTARPTTGASSSRAAPTARCWRSPCAGGHHELHAPSTVQSEAGGRSPAGGLRRWHLARMSY
jgi:hypothetical protein